MVSFPYIPVVALSTWVQHTGQILSHLRYCERQLTTLSSILTYNVVQIQISDLFSNDAPFREPCPFPKWPPKADENNMSEGQKFKPPRSYDFSWTKAPQDKCRLCGKKYNLSCLISLLPRREACDTLCNLFFATVFPLIPIIHLRGFSGEVEAFWQGLPTENLHATEPSLFLRKQPGFLCLFSSILFAALASSSQSRIKSIFGDETEIYAEDMYFIAMVSASLTGFPRNPSTYSLAAFIFAQSQFVREEEFSDAPDFISTSFRIALGMGLHRQLSGADFTVAEFETRRRLWWYILHLDVMSSCSSGLSPLFVDEKMANTDAICNYEEEEGNEQGRKQNGEYSSLGTSFGKLSLIHIC